MIRLGDELKVSITNFHPLQMHLILNLSIAEAISLSLPGQLIVASDRVELEFFETETFSSKCK